MNSKNKEINSIFSQASEVAAALENLDRSRRKLKELDKLQKHISPLLKQKQNLETEIAKSKANLNAKLDQLQLSAHQLENQISQVPQMRQAVLTADERISELEKKKVYQKRLEEKGTERRHFQEKLQENQRRYEKQWQELQQKLEMLVVPEATCPLCEQNLDEQHRHHVVEKTTKEQKITQEQIWTIREQLATCEKELQLLRQEYKDISQELSDYDRLRQELGHLEAQLEATEDTYEQLEKIESEKSALEKSLSTGDFAYQLQVHLQQLEGELTHLKYDEQTHALIRGEVDRWRWAEIKQAKIEDAQKRQAKLSQQKPQLVAKIASLSQEIENLEIDSPIKKQIDQVFQEIAELGYDNAQHQQLLDSLRKAHNYHLQYQELQKAQEKYPQLQTKATGIISTVRS